MSAKRKLPRRERCYLVAKGIYRLDMRFSEYALVLLADELSELGERDLPKFDDLLKAIRRATIMAIKEPQRHGDTERK